MEDKVVKLRTTNTYEVENKLLKQNVHSLKQRNDHLDEIVAGYMGLVEKQQNDHKELSYQTQKLAGEIVGKHNKKL